MAQRWKSPPPLGLQLDGCAGVLHSHQAGYHRNAGLIGVEARTRRRGTPADRRGLGGGSVLIPTPQRLLLDLCALNFSKGGRPGTIGHSGNVSESEQRRARRRLPLTRLFISVSLPSICVPLPSTLLFLSSTSTSPALGGKQRNPLINEGYVLHSSISQTLL